MLENRSFDHMLGDLSLSIGRTDVDGLRAGMNNPDGFGGTVAIQAVTNQRYLTDPSHSFRSVAEQLSGAGGRLNQGFVTNYEREFSELAKKRRFAPEIMFYQTAQTAPVIYALAMEYALSDTWFCSVPSETWPNRIFTTAASTAGRLTNRLRLYDLPSVYTRLRDVGREWACYNDQIPNMINIRKLAGEWLKSRHEPDSRFRSIGQFEDDCRAARLPDYSFIEPVYFFGDANDDHPPHDVIKGQQLMARIYLAVRNSPLWERTMLVITADEHGGFFDHVFPPKGDWVPAPDNRDPKKNDFEFDFHQLGPRVPLVVVSSLVSRASVFRADAAKCEYYDHTSLIRTLAEKWSFPALTQRDAAAKDLWSALDLEKPRTDDGETLAQITAWYREQRPKVLGATDDRAMQGLSGRRVAARIAEEGRPHTLTATNDVHSEFQVSMEHLAEEVLMQADVLETEARM